MCVRQVRRVANVAFHADFRNSLILRKSGGIRTILSDPILTDGVQPLPSTRHGMKIAENDTLGQALMQFQLGVEPKGDKNRKNVQKMKVERSSEDCIEDIKQYVKTIKLDSDVSIGIPYKGINEILSTIRKADDLVNETPILKPEPVTNLSKGFTLSKSLLTQEAINNRLSQLKDATPVKQTNLGRLSLSSSIPKVTPLVSHSVFKVPIENPRCDKKFNKFIERFKKVSPNNNQTKRRPQRRDSGKFLVKSSSDMTNSIVKEKISENQIPEDSDGTNDLPEDSDGK